MISSIISGTLAFSLPWISHPADFNPYPQCFQQEVATRDFLNCGLHSATIQILDVPPQSAPRIFVDGVWNHLIDAHWKKVNVAPPPDNQFVFHDHSGQTVTVALPWRHVRQIQRRDHKIWLATSNALFLFADDTLQSLDWPGHYKVNQMAVPIDHTVIVASNAGLFESSVTGWNRIIIPDGTGRTWASSDVLGVAFDAENKLWFATRAGVGCRTGNHWRFYEGKDGLPWNDFTAIAASPDGAVWFATRLGVIRHDHNGWHYRQGPRWLPHDDVHDIAVDEHNNLWLATAAGLGLIERIPLTLDAKAAFYEDEIARYVKRTPLGYVAEAHLRRAGDKSSADPQDSDNDGLWTAMYGAAQCFAHAATGDLSAGDRARQAFNALRFLQKVTQGADHAPPRGYVARTIRPTDWPDPNVGRADQDRQAQQFDKLWKVYEPRWPKSADGRWYWKSDTSSDELDGHYFFYALYHDFCADTQPERHRVQEVVRDLTDHLLTHHFVLMDHDGRPTRWAIFGPQHLNRDPDWWPERGLNSLSILSYLAVATHVTGDPKYEAASRELIDLHGYAQNAMYPKLQHGPGSGNQSDDEMAFMCYYSLLRCSRDTNLIQQIRFSFFRYWANEAPEMNPLFNFAYAAHNLDAVTTNPWGTFPLRPWNDWLPDSMATLHGFPLDRLNWSHRNSHRLDLVPLGQERARDLYRPHNDRRGHRVNGKVLPVENRHFPHWNTDPWQLDYHGSGNELAAGTVFLLPYYMGLYHGFIAKP